MVKPLNEFGGWLRFFQFSIFLNIVSLVFQGFMLIESFLKSSEKLLLLGEIAQFGFLLFIFHNIFKILPERKVETPVKIRHNLFTVFIVSIFAFLYYTSVSYFVLKKPWEFENTVRLMLTLHSMIWLTIWHSYFEKSRRVAAYYNEEIDVIV